MLAFVPHGIARPLSMAQSLARPPGPLPPPSFAALCPFLLQDALVGMSLELAEARSSAEARSQSTGSELARLRSDLELARAELAAAEQVAQSQVGAVQRCMLDWPFGYRSGLELAAAEQVGAEISTLESSSPAAALPGCACNSSSEQAAAAAQVVQSQVRALFINTQVSGALWTTAGWCLASSGSPSHVLTTPTSCSPHLPPQAAAVADAQRLVVIAATAAEEQKAVQVRRALACRLHCS